MKNTALNKKQWLIYALILIIGIALGWLAFGGSSEEAKDAHAGHAHEESAEEVWTCSMHPQIRQPEPGDCPICGMDLIPAESSSVNSSPAQIEMSKQAIQLANIQTEPVKLSSAKKEIHLQGKIEIDERRISAQSAHFPGRIEKLYVAFEGERIHNGQRLASIYSPELATAQKELLEAAKTKDEYPQLYTAAQNKLKLLKLSDKQIAQIEQSGMVKEYFDIYADASGFITQKRVSPGDYIKAGEVLFDVADMQRLWVKFDAYERDLPFISVGDEIEFIVSSLPSKSYSVKISYIDPVIDQQKRTAALRAEVTNSDGKLKPQMFVHGKLSSNLKYAKEALVIPKSAVMWTGKRSVVYVRVPNADIPLFEFREIEIGESLGNFYVVNSGVAEGEEVVTYGTFTVDAAAQLNSKYSMMNPPVKEKKEDVPDYSNARPDAFANQFQAVISVYLTLTESLVAADAETVQKEVKKLLNTLEKIDMMLLKGDAHDYWMEQSKIIKEEGKKIAGSKNIDTQRKAFKPLSEAVINITKSYLPNQNKLYIQYCPMADNDLGAFWLSTQSQINNPYFGDMMLRCGETKDTIQ
jgi:Cu(I)/Ag(I) efflux system membrane fusion protein